MTASLPSFRRSSSAFTLVELLVVCAIVTVLFALGAPMTMSLLQASKMNQASALISDELNYARQKAMSRNCEIEVRFYKVGTDDSPQNKQFRAFRSFFVAGDDPKQYKPSGDLHHLPGPVVISDDPKVSTLFDYGNPKRSGLTISKEALPSSTTPADYISFLFRPQGGTNLGPIDPPEGNWYLTFYLESAPKDRKTGIPHNFCTVQVEPVTGKVRFFRP